MSNGSYVRRIIGTRAICYQGVVIGCEHVCIYCKTSFGLDHIVDEVTSHEMVSNGHYTLRCKVCGLVGATRSDEGIK